MVDDIAFILVLIGALGLWLTNTIKKKEIERLQKELKKYE